MSKQSLRRNLVKLICLALSAMMVLSVALQPSEAVAASSKTQKRPREISENWYNKIRKTKYYKKQKGIKAHYRFTARKSKGMSTIYAYGRNIGNCRIALQKKGKKGWFTAKTIPSKMLDKRIYETVTVRYKAKAPKSWLKRTSIKKVIEKQEDESSIEPEQPKTLTEHLNDMVLKDVNTLQWSNIKYSDVVKEEGNLPAGTIVEMTNLGTGKVQDNSTIRVSLINKYDQKVSKTVKKVVRKRPDIKKERTLYYSIYRFKLRFPRKYWQDEYNTRWRAVLYDKNGRKVRTLKYFNIKPKRYYQNWKGYAQLRQKHPAIDHPRSIGKGYMGHRVLRIHNFFGIGDRNWPIYTQNTANRVRAFQRRKGLKATGRVNWKTWKKMGYSYWAWKNLDTYQSPIKTKPSTTRSEAVEIFIKRAFDYKGNPYVVGASGRPGQGLDCSALVTQAMYACGVTVGDISSSSHTRPGRQFESRLQWKSKKLRPIKRSNRRRGDLIFYLNGNGVVYHVAIYLGNNKIIDAWPNYVRVTSVNFRGNWRVKRVFN